MRQKSEQIALLSLPSSGSTWFAKVLIDSIPGLFAPADPSYEFFQPTRSVSYRGLISRAFGNEMVSHYQKIAIPSSHQPYLDEIYLDTWLKEPYNFCKEVWSFAKFPFFYRHFRCIVLIRDAESTFPPNRLRVYGWYDAIWNSYRSRGNTLLIADRSDPDAIAREAHDVASKALIFDASLRWTPILSYKKLVTGTPEEVAQELNQEWLVSIDTKSIVNEILRTRAQIGRPQNGR